MIDLSLRGLTFLFVKTMHLWWYVKVTLLICIRFLFSACFDIIYTFSNALFICYSFINVSLSIIYILALVYVFWYHDVCLYSVCMLLLFDMGECQYLLELMLRFFYACKYFMTLNKISLPYFFINGIDNLFQNWPQKGIMWFFQHKICWFEM